MFSILIYIFTVYISFISRYLVVTSRKIVTFPFHLVLYLLTLVHTSVGAIYILTHSFQQRGSALSASVHVCWCFVNPLEGDICQDYDRMVSRTIIYVDQLLELSFI